MVAPVAKLLSTLGPLTLTLSRREGGPLNCAPSADAVAGNGRPLSWAPSADAVAGGGESRQGILTQPRTWRSMPILAR
jgi:hypothetical protein